MFVLFSVIHIVVIFVIIGLVLLHRSKGSSMGVSLGGGSSQTVFGAAGPSSFLAKVIAVAGALFFITSILLSVSLKSENNSDLIEKVNQVELEQQPQPTKETKEQSKEQSIDTLPE